MTRSIPRYRRMSCAHRSRTASRRRSAIAGRRQGEQGLTNVEYALLIAVAAVLVIVGLGVLGGKIDDRLSTSASGPGTINGPGTLKLPVALCDPNYAGACVPPPPPDLDCKDLRALGLPLPVSVVGGDPHRLDPDGDGLGC
jgi:Flp pilus assembly pilin Flp